MGSSADILTQHGITVDGETLEHYGVPGMRWGKRRKAKNARREENSRRAEARAKVKDMSDDDLKSAINRLKLENEFKSLNAHQVSQGQKIVGEILKDIGKQQAKRFINGTIESLATKAKDKDDDEVSAALIKKALKSAPKVNSGRPVVKLAPKHLF